MKLRNSSMNSWEENQAGCGWPRSPDTTHHSNHPLDLRNVVRTIKIEHFITSLIHIRRLLLSYREGQGINGRLIPVHYTQWCKFMSKNLNFAREILRGGRGRTRVGGATKKREISRTF